ncbi:MAG: DUF3108 domain-containing protein [Vicinamibacterales bacterium]
MKALVASVGVVVAAAVALAGAAGLPDVPRAKPAPAQRKTPPPPARTARAVPRADTAVPFRVGETLTFDVTLASYVVAGTAVTSVRERRVPDGEPAAYYIVAEGKPLPLMSRFYSLYYKMDTLLDTATLLPRRTTLYSEEGTRQRLGTTRFDRAARKAFFERTGDGSIKTDVTVPPQVQDGLSALYAIRASAIAAGTKLSYPIIDEGSVYTVSMQASTTERIRVPLGDIDAWKLGVNIVDSQGQPVAENVGVWISNDARRLPVRMQADLPVGSFVLALRDVRSRPAD